MNKFRIEKVKFNKKTQILTIFNKNNDDIKMDLNYLSNVDSPDSSFFETLGICLFIGSILASLFIGILSIINWIF